MKQTVYSILGILLSATSALSASAQAQPSPLTYVSLPGCAAGTNMIGYYNRSCTPNVEKRADTEYLGSTSFTFSKYRSTISNATTTAKANDVFQYTDDYSSQILGTALVWRQNSTDTPLPAGIENSDVNVASPFRARVTLTFTREVTNLKLVFQDIDKGLLQSGSGNGGSDYTDEVDFYPTDAAGAATDISSAGAVQVGYGANGNLMYGSTCQYQGVQTRNNQPQAVIQGTGLAGSLSNPNRTGNVTIVFTKPLKTLVLTYRNLNTLTYKSPLRLQTIAIEQISWCKQATPLPVTLTTFDAKAAGADAALNWGTANEVNSDYFGVERSFDGVSFSQIGRVNSHGNSIAANSYTYTDAGVAAKAAGTVYYRLRQVDLDGTATYSPVRTVAFEKGAAALKLYPNPATPGNDNLTLDLLTLPQGDYQASLANVVGSTVATYAVRGGQAQPMPLPTALAPGTYIMRVQGQGVSLTQRLMRQ